MSDAHEYRTTEEPNELRIELAEQEPLPEVDPQAERRMEIAEAYEKRREAEIAAQREQMGLPPEEDTTAEPVAEAAPEHAAQADVRYPPVPPTPPAAPQLFPMPLPDGRITYVTSEQAAYLAQVGVATLSQPQAPPQQPAYAPPQSQQYRQPPLDAERARVLAQRLSYGTPDEQAEALQEFAAVVRPAYDKEQLKRELRQEQTLETNLAIIGREYPEIFNDPVLTQVAAVQLHTLRGNPMNLQLPEIDQYRYACNVVRSRFNVAPQQSAPQSQPENRGLSSGRLERKRNAPSIPGGADHRLTMQEAAPREPTTSEIINQIRKARGQAVAS
jgi:hypothetical protein